MNKYPEKVRTLHENYSTAIGYRFPSRNIKTSSSSIITEDERLARKNTSKNEVLQVCQALLLSTCVLLLSYYSIRYGQTEYSVLENGQLVYGYKPKAVVTLNLGYSVSYSLVSFLAIGMLAYSLVSKRPRWSLPSIILYLTNLVYDVSAVLASILLFLSNCSLPAALFYATGSVLLILDEIWIWLGVLRLYEQRTFK